MIVFDCIRRWRALWPTRGNTQSPGAVIAQPRDDLTGATQTYELDDAGMSTAEYAVGTIAACAFAAVLYKVVTSGAILSLLSGVVSKALHVPF